MKQSQKQIVHERFFNAATAYYLGGDWKGILLATKNKLIGSHRRLFEDLCSCDGNKFHNVVCRYLDSFAEEQMENTNV